MNVGMNEKPGAKRVAAGSWRWREGKGGEGRGGDGVSIAPVVWLLPSSPGVKDCLGLSSLT